MRADDSDRTDAVRSVSLDELLAGRTPWWRDLLKAKVTIPAVSMLALSVAAGSAVYALKSGPQENAVLKLEEPAPVYTGSLPTAAETAASVEVKPVVLPEPDPTAAARLPRPRPVVSAPRPGPDQRYAYADAREPDPCSALRAMSAYLPFRVYCVSEPRRAPPRPRYRSYQPYGHW